MMRADETARRRLPGGAGRAAILGVVGLAVGLLLGRTLGGAVDDGSVRTFRAEVLTVTETGGLCVAEEGTGRHQGCGVVRLARGQTLPARGDSVVVQEVLTPEAAGLKVSGTRLYVFPLERQYFR